MFRRFLRWLFSGHVFEIAALFFAAIGVSMGLAPDKEDILRAHWFFGIAFVLAAGRLAYWLISEQTIKPKPLIAAVCFAVVGGSWMAVYQWVESKVPKPPPVPAPTQQLPPPPFNVTRSISLGNFVVIPSPMDEKFAAIRMQLLPPLQDEYPNRYIINAVLLSFENSGSATDRNVSLKVYLPGVREVACTSDRIHVVEGNLGATFVNFLIPELSPEEEFSCKVDFMQIVNDIPTIEAWKKKYGSVSAWSELRGQFDVLIYRVGFGPEEHMPAGSSKPLRRKITFHLK
jgi:hypothetical protein